MKVREEKIPSTLIIEKALDHVDFSDNFATTNHKDNLCEISNKIFNTVPSWVKVLMYIRNGVMTLLNRQMKKPADYNEDWKVGGYVGFFKIFQIEEDEVLLGLDDKHLNFRVSIWNSREANYNIKTTTLVEYNNKFGRFYMSFVKPFHRVVVKSMVKNAFVPSH